MQQEVKSEQQATKKTRTLKRDTGVEQREASSDWRTANSKEVAESSELSTAKYDQRKAIA